LRSISNRIACPAHAGANVPLVLKCLPIRLARQVCHLVQVYASTWAGAAVAEATTVDT
jgi:hypothetical protein